MVIATIILLGARIYTIVILGSRAAVTGCLTKAVQRIPLENVVEM